MCSDPTIKREESMTEFPSRWVTALPIYNEARHVNAVLDEVARYSPEVLVVNDGSTDGTAEILSQRSDIRCAHHESNRGYGAALITAFQYAIQHAYEVIVTIDCDRQHEPKRIPRFVSAAQNTDIVSGSRYLKVYQDDTPPPEQRRRINQDLTAELNRRLNLNLTDAFCGFKAYRIAALKRMTLTEPGYGMPLELWTQAAAQRLSILELPVPLIYLEEARSFGGMLDDGKTRLAYYRRVLDQSIAVVGPDVFSQAKSNCDSACREGTG